MEIHARVTNKKNCVERQRERLKRLRRDHALVYMRIIRGTERLEAD